MTAGAAALGAAGAAFFSFGAAAFAATGAAFFLDFSNALLRATRISAYCFFVVRRSARCSSLWRRRRWSRRLARTRAT